MTTFIFTGKQKGMAVLAVKAETLNQAWKLLSEKYGITNQTEWEGKAL